MRILLITMGTTPQIVTETLYALVGAQPPWVPDEIMLLATGHSARLLENTDSEAALLGANGQLARLGAAFGIADLAQRVRIRTVQSRTGIALDDIRSAQDVGILAENLLQLVASLTDNPDVTLHLSMAGGRKTMSFIAGQIMSLFGRAQDRLSHILVHPARLESNRNFWWPDTTAMKEARVELHLVPFLRLRAWLDQDRLHKMAQQGFANAVAIANAAVGEANVLLDLESGKLCIAGRTLHLSPREAALFALAAIAEKRRQQLAVVRRWHATYPKWTSPALDGQRSPACRLWAWLCMAGSLSHLNEGFPSATPHSFDAATRALAERLLHGDIGATDASHPYGELIGQPLSRLRRKLRDALPSILAARLMDPRRIACTLPPSAVALKGPEALIDHPGWPAELVAADRATTSA